MPLTPSLKSISDVIELRPNGVPPAAPARHQAQVPPPVSRKHAVIEPLAPARYKVEFTASAELHDKLDRLRDLMRTSVPDGDLAQLIEAAVTEKLERLEARRFGKTAKARQAPEEPRPGGHSSNDAARPCAHQARGPRTRRRTLPVRGREQQA